MAIRHFKIQVNGQTFEVAVEEILDGTLLAAGPRATTRVQVASTTVGAPGAQIAPATIGATPQATQAGGSGWVVCPMGGKILKIPVKVGQTVKPDSVVAIIEAMKMETSVCAGQPGTIMEIAATEGSVVDSAAPLVRIG